jgi:3-dehydroquinate dehydratase/shikimate dehydrogenase
MTAAKPTYTPRLYPLRPPRVCVAVVGADAAEMVEKAEALVRDNPFIEFRLDYLKRPATVLQRLRRFVQVHPEAVVIATCRRAANGGRFRGSVDAQLNVLNSAAATGCQFVDIELQTAAKMTAKDFERIRAKAGLVLSFHDFRSTQKLDQILEKMLQYPADYLKIVTTASRLYDNVVMMKFLEEQSHRYSLVGLCMGEQGIISRILGVRAGSAFTFAAFAPGEETAPGQISAKELRDIYRIDQVDRATRVYGVVGDPVAHSLSPLMMNMAFRRENVNAVYLPLHAKSLSDALACVRETPIHGLSVTMPYKEEIIEHLDNTDPLTVKIGACNTVVRAQDGKLYGFNTDVIGVIRPLEQRLVLARSRFLVIGAGGAARAAVFGLKERGAEVYIMNRTPAAGKKLAHQAHARFVRRADLPKMTFHVIINATPVGMGKAQVSPLQEKEINARYVMEMVYSPAETRFTKLARGRGAEVISGSEMFVHQGARQFEIWTGKPAPVEEMRRVVQAALAAATPVPVKKRA